MTTGPHVVRIDALDDPRLAPYRELVRSRDARHSGRFIAEGRLLVERLAASPLAIESLLATPARQAWATALLAGRDSPPPTLLLASNERLKELLGYDFHRGMLACGVRPPARSLAEIVPPPPAAGGSAPCRIVACPVLTDPENVGGVLRCAQAFGCHGVLLGERCGDPFSRRVLRVSMGAPLHLPVVQVDDFDAALVELRERQVELFATVLDPAAEPLATVSPPPLFALLVGNEGYGLDAATIARCQRRITLPMHPTADSLNVSVATGIFLYHFTRRAAGVE